MKILLAQSDPVLRGKIRTRLDEAGYEVREAWDSSSLADAVEQDGARLMLLDLALAGGESCEVLAQVRKRRPQLPVVVLADGSPPERVAHATALGVLECIVGEPNLEALVAHVREILKGQPISVETHGHGALWTEDTLEIYKALERAAASDAPVLITGETGTGKEVGARTLHELSPRRGAPFIGVNCAALSEDLLESEIFGHEKGAFTSATHERAGRLETAKHGFIVLDEVAELGVHLQAKFLRVLQERSYERVGSDLSRPLRARIVATSNRDIEAEVEAGKFRKDLYFRLNVIRIHMPALRERPREIAAFVEFFFGARGKRVGEETMAILRRHSWPGNVREVEELAEGVGVLFPGHEVLPVHLPARILKAIGDSLHGNGSSELATLREVVAEAERKHILQALKAAGGKQNKAAEILGITRTTLAVKIRGYGLEMRSASSPRPRHVQAPAQ